MTEQTPYEKLGVSEDASFDEIQNVRSRLLSEHSDDSKHSETIEAAYDAILIDDSIPGYSNDETYRFEAKAQSHCSH